MLTSSMYFKNDVDSFCQIIPCSCNWVGGWASIRAMDWYGKQRLKDTPFATLEMHGKAVGQYVNIDNFSFAYVIFEMVAGDFTQDLHFRRIYQSGHEVVSS
jgi:hypothetical protein